MRKKLVCLALVATMTASMAVSAFGASADVIATFDAYNAVVEAIENNDAEALKDALTVFEKNSSDLDDAENEALMEMFEGDPEDVAAEMIGNIMVAGAIFEVGTVYDAFVADKNIENAANLLEKNQYLQEDEELATMISDFYSDYEDVCAEALALTEENAGYDVYVLYRELLSALEGGDMESVQAAAEALVDPMNEISEEQMEGLAEIFDAEAEEAMTTVLDVFIRANVYVDFCKKFTAFSDDCNGKTAKEFVEYYDSIYNEDYEDEALEQLIADHYTGVEYVYKEAKVWAEAQDVVDLYADVVSGVEDKDLASVKDILDEFGIALDSMDEEKWEVVAQISSASVEELPWEMIYYYTTANVLVEIEDILEEFLDDPNEDTANALVEIYNGVYFDEAYVDEYLREIVPEFFEGIEESYEEAKALLAGEGASEDVTEQETTAKETVKETEKETSKDTAPGTGDAATALPLLGMLAAGACVVAGKKKEA